MRVDGTSSRGFLRFLSLTAFQAEGGGGGFAADYKKAGPHPPVISTVAGQPPIGKPLIVQARGQLRLTWRLYAESPQSGEISLRNVANPWWQEISRLCVSLEPKVFTTHTGRSPARDDDAGEQLTVIYQKGSH